MHKSAGNKIVPYTVAVDGDDDGEMEYIQDIADSVRAVERLLKYQFKDKKLLEEALTHSSYTDSASYQRLEFIGDAALGLAISNFVFLAYPDLDPGQLSLLRAANISTEKLARVAVRHGLYRYVRHNAAALDEKVRDFALAVQKEDDTVVYGGVMKAPKVLADIVESVRRQSPLFAEMGPVYIFKEPIGPEGMARLASRGGDMLPSFGNGAGLPWLATNEHVQIMAEESALLDAEIGGCIHLLYHPNLLSEHYCPDASNSGAAGMLRRPAEVVGQVHVATRMRPAEALWALAYRGPMSLLPLAVNNVHENSLEP